MSTTTNMVVVFQGTGEDAMFALFVLCSIVGGAFLFTYLFKQGYVFWV